MILNEAIERYTSNAEYERIHGNLQGCLEFRQLAEWLKDYKRLLEQEPCEDATTRILKRMWNCRGKHTTSIDKVKMEQIIRDELPSVTPQPKTGHWIYIKNSEVNGLKIVKCSECGKRTYGSGRYCPNCGCKMESEE